MVPVEFLSRALGPIYDRRIDLRRPSRLLIVGDMNVPRVVARIDAVGPPTRAIIDVTPSAPVTVASEAGRVIVRIDADALDLTLPAGSGLIEQIRAGDQPNTVALVLGGGAGTPRTATNTTDGAARIMIDVPAAPAAGGDTTAAAPPTPPPPTDTLPVGTPRARFALIAIDPGHGGADVGVKTSDGLEEKELTLDVARRVRQRLETRLGVRVILTRDEDKALTLDERAAFANNSKADLFLSLHANGALGPGVAGAEVYFLSLDREGETVRRTATAAAVSLPVLGGGRRLVEVVPWNLAQAAHIDKSATLAAMLEEELRRRVPMSPRAVQSRGDAGPDRREHAGGAGRDGLPDQPRSGGQSARRRVSQCGRRRRVRSRRALPGQPPSRSPRRDASPVPSRRDRRCGAGAAGVGRYLLARTAHGETATRQPSSPPSRRQAKRRTSPQPFSTRPRKATR